jgi:hypothetical protein
MVGKLLIQSQNRDPNVSNSVSDYTITNFNPPIDLRGKRYCRMVYAKIPNTVYNIQSGYNNLDVTETGHPTWTLVISPGAYTTASLTTYLATALTAASVAGNTFTATYNATTLQLTITANNVTFSLPFGSGPSAGLNVYKQLGFFTNPGVPTNTGAALSVTGTQAVNLFRPYSFSICLEQFSPNFGEGIVTGDNVKGNPNYLIPPGGANIGTFLMENNGITSIFSSFIGVMSRPEIVKISEKLVYLNSIRVMLIDNTMHQLAQLNGVDWEFCIDFLEEKDYPLARVL